MAQQVQELKGVLKYDTANAVKALKDADGLVKQLQNSLRNLEQRKTSRSLWGGGLNLSTMLQAERRWASEIEKQRASIFQRIANANDGRLTISPALLQQVQNANQTPTISRFQQMNQSIQRVNDSLYQTRALLFTIGAGYLLNKLQEIPRYIYDTSVVISGAHARLMLLAGSTKGASEEFEWLKKKTYELGVNLKAATEEYSLFGATAKDYFNVQQTREIYTNLMKASTAFHLTPEAFSRVSYALREMLNKGKIYSQDFYMQLGTHLPGAVNIASRALGIKTEQLKKAMKDGTLNAKEFVYKFTKELGRTVDPILGAALNSPLVAMNRMQQSFFELAAIAGDAGWTEGMINFFNAVDKFAQSKGVIDFVKWTGILVKNLSTVSPMLIQSLISLTSMLAFLATSQFFMSAWTVIAGILQMHPVIRLITIAIGAITLLWPVISKIITAIRNFFNDRLPIIWFTFCYTSGQVFLDELKRAWDGFMAYVIKNPMDFLNNYAQFSINPAGYFGSQIGNAINNSLVDKSTIKVENKIQIDKTGNAKTQTDVKRDFDWMWTPTDAFNIAGGIK